MDKDVTLLKQNNPKTFEQLVLKYSKLIPFKNEELRAQANYLLVLFLKKLITREVDDNFKLKEAVIIFLVQNVLKYRKEDKLIRIPSTSQKRNKLKDFKKKNNFEIVVKLDAFDLFSFLETLDTYCLDPREKQFIRLKIKGLNDKETGKVLGMAQSSLNKMKKGLEQRIFGSNNETRSFHS